MSQLGGVRARWGNKLKRYIPHDAASELLPLSGDHWKRDEWERGRKIEREREKGKLIESLRWWPRKWRRRAGGQAGTQTGDSRGHMRVINAVEERATYGLEGRREGVSHAAVMIAGAGGSQGTQGRGKEGERAWVLSARSPRMAL